MKQLYYTSCRAGRSVDGYSGFQVRAVSRDVSRDRIRAALRYSGYSLPSSVSPSDLTKDLAPVRLALLIAPDLGRLLCHSNYVGRDPTTNRFGNYFSHIVLGDESEIDPRQAIQTWEDNDFWTTEDGDFRTELDDVPELTTAEAFDDAGLSAFAADNHSGQIFRFALTALVTGSESDQVILAAPALTVAHCIFGLTRVLPSGMIKGFSFSTYESEPLVSPARLVGTCWDGAARELPSACYDGSRRGYNSFTGRKTPLPRTPPYVDFAVNAVVEGRWDALGGFLRLCERLDVDHLDLLEMVDRLENQGGDFARDDIRHIAEKPELTEWMTRRTSAARFIAETTCDEPTFRQTVLPFITATLQRGSEGRTKLIASIVDEGAYAIRDGRLDRLKIIFESVLPAFSADESGDARRLLIDSTSPSDQLAWEVWLYLLGWLHRLVPTLDSRSTPWLDVPTPSRKIGEILALDIDDSWRLVACQFCLAREGRITPELVQSLAPRRELVLEVIKYVGDSTDGRLAIQLFEALLKRPESRLSVEDLLQLGSALPLAVYDGCLNAALKQQCIDMPKLVREHRSSLLSLSDKARSLPPIVNWFLERLTDEAWDDPAVVDFLRSVASRPSAPEINYDLLGARLGFAAFERQPSLDPRTLEVVDQRLDLLAGPARQQIEARILTAIVGALAAAPENGDAASAVEAVLQSFSRRGMRMLSDVYSWLLQGLNCSPAIWERAETLTSLLAAGLGVFRESGLLQQYKTAGPEARETLGLAARRLARRIVLQSPRTVLSEVKERIGRWEGEAPRPWPLDLHGSFAIMCVRGFQFLFRTSLRTGSYLPLVLPKIRSTEDASVELASERSPLAPEPEGSAWRPLNPSGDAPRIDR